jgi:hypothetical protein
MRILAKAALTFMLAAMAASGVPASASGGQANAADAETRLRPATRDIVIGRWTDDGDCGNSVDLRPDGSLGLSDGRGARWTLVGDRLSFIGEQTVTAQVLTRDGSRIFLLHADNSQGYSERCPLAGGGNRVRPITRGELLGRWTDDGDCGNAVDFRSDGNFILPNSRGRWTLVGDELTFIGNLTIRVKAETRTGREIVITHADNSVGGSTRCP